MTPFISIGIPTWNRSATLQSSVKRLLCLVANTQTQIGCSFEILISDNASTDDTQSVCLQLAAAHPNLININRNNSNIGFSKNIDRIFHVAKGEYVMILSDDDSIEDDALSCLATALRAHPDTACAYMRATSYSHDLTSCTEEKKRDALRHQYPNSKPYIYCPNPRALYKHRHTLTNVCISGCVFKRENWINTDLALGSNSGSIQLYAAHQLQTQGGGILCIERPAIQYRADEITSAQSSYVTNRAGGWGSGFPFVYPFDEIQALVASKAKYEPDIYKSYYRDCLRNLWQTLVDARAKKFPFNKDYFLSRLSKELDLSVYPSATSILVTTLNTPIVLILLTDKCYKFLRAIYFKLFR